MVPATTKSNARGSRSHTSTAAQEQRKKSRTGRLPALRASRGDIFVEASIKYVVCLFPVFLMFIFSFPELDKAVTPVSICSTSRSTRLFDTFIFPLGHWRGLWSRPDFSDDQSLKNCANVLHIKIIKIWEQIDGKKGEVSFLQSPSFYMLTESVSIK